MRKHKCTIIYGYASCLYRKAWLLLSFLLIILCTIFGITIYSKTDLPDGQIDLEFETPEFLVNNNECKIPNVVPWNSEFKPFYKPKSPYKCSEKDMLTTIIYEGDQAFLYINKSVASSYTLFGNDIKCCYQTVLRGTKDKADIDITYSECHKIENRQLINATEVVVKCTEKYTHRKIYSNAHPIILKSPKVKDKINAMKGKEKPPSLLLFGLDSISRLNFHRMLPLTKEYLDKSGWIEYKGYNKVGENTFPNLMALLTGKNFSGIYETCNPYHVGTLDRCNFIWKNFSDSNYVTTYIEDAISISTFTFLKKGFLDPPTDLYYKPYMTAAEDLGTKLLDDMYFCSGPVSSGERILQAAKDFIIQIGDHPKFGLFWSNSFSHDNINTPARMDRILSNFFKEIEKYLENTIVFIFSDHGMRFGSIRQTKTGWYEERLPFAYFWIPKKFQKKHPLEYHNLLKNSQTLTTPYDIYMTSQHILELYDNKKVRSICDATTNCKSLFEDISDRSCEDLNIPLHYCTCFGYKPISIKLPIIQNAAKVAVEELNTIIKEDHNTSVKCAEYKYNKVTLAQIANYKNVSYILFQLHTVPKAIFEFTMSFNHSSATHIGFKREGDISRLDKYESTSKCVNEKKLYCYCRFTFQMYMNFFSFWFEV